MRLFFISWDGKEVGLNDVVARLQKKSFDIVYWTYFSEKDLDATQFPATIFHSVSDALAGKPARGIDVSNFQPPGSDVIKMFQNTELTVLTMMDKKYERLAVEERKHLYYRLLGYWHEVLQRLKPDAIIFSVLPHEVYDFVVYAIAKKMNIKVILFQPILLTNGWNLILNDYTNESPALRDEMRKQSGTQFSVADLKPDTREHYQKHAENGEDTPPIYTRQVLSLHKGMRLLFIKLRSVWLSLRVHRDLSVLVAVLTYMPRMFLPNLKNEYRRFQSPPDFGEEFIYTTLQYQPEAQTCPQAGVFADQLLMIETLSAALPPGWFVYVKEHPSLWPVRGLKFYHFRYQGYYESIARLKNVKLVPVETDSFQLIRHAKAVATGAGSVGWEALLRSKPVLVFGYPWYQSCEGVCKVTDRVSCRAVLEKIKNGFEISQQKVINFLACVDTVSVEAYFSGFAAGISKIGPRQNTENILRAIETELRRKEL